MTWRRLALPSGPSPSTPSLHCASIAAAVPSFNRRLALVTKTTDRTVQFVVDLRSEWVYVKPAMTERFGRLKLKL
jgi:hypothetical protein